MEPSVDLSESFICRRISPLFAMKTSYWQLLHCHTILPICFTYVDFSGITTSPPHAYEAHETLYRPQLFLEYQHTGFSLEKLIAGYRLNHEKNSLPVCQEAVPGPYGYQGGSTYPEMLIFELASPVLFNASGTAVIISITTYVGGECFEGREKMDECLKLSGQSIVHIECPLVVPLVHMVV